MAGNPGARQGPDGPLDAWGGDERTNAFITWVGDEVKRRYGVRVEQVKLKDTAEAVCGWWRRKARAGAPMAAST